MRDRRHGGRALPRPQGAQGAPGAGMSGPPLQRVVFLLNPEQVELREVAVPDPGPGEFLLKIGAATTCGTDVKVFRRGGHPRMLKVPTPLRPREIADTGVELSRARKALKVLLVPG